MDGIPGGRALLESIRFDYDESPAVSLLVSATETAWRKSPEGTYSHKRLPSAVFQYSGHSWCREVRASEEVVLDDRCRFFDLYQEGIPGILYEDDVTGEMLYRANLGQGRFDGRWPSGRLWAAGYSPTSTPTGNASSPT